MFGKLEIRNECSRQELMHQVQDMLKFVEDAYQQSQAAHVVEEGIFCRILEIGRLAVGLFLAMSGRDMQANFWFQTSTPRTLKQAASTVVAQFSARIGHSSRTKIDYSPRIVKNLVREMSLQSSKCPKFWVFL